MMSSGHLPAGRAAHGGVAVVSAMDAMVPDDQSAGVVSGGGVQMGAGGGGGRGGRRGRHYSSHYNNQNGRHGQNSHGQSSYHAHNHNHNHNQNGYHGQNGHHNQYSHSSHQMGQQMFQGYMNPYNNPYGFPMPQFPNGAMPASFVAPYQQNYGRPMPGVPGVSGVPGVPPQYPPMMAPGGMPPLPQAGPGHPQHPSMPPHSQIPLQPQHPQHASQHHIPPQPHMSPYSRNDPVVVSSTMPAQPLPPSMPSMSSMVSMASMASMASMSAMSAMPAMPAMTSMPGMPPSAAHAPLPPPPAGLPQQPHMPPPPADLHQPLPSHMQPPMQPLQPPVLPPTPSSTVSSSHGPIPTPKSPRTSHEAAAYTGEVLSSEALSGEYQATVADFEAAFAASNDISAVIVPSASFRPPLPWLSRPDIPFPTKSSKLRRRRKTMGKNVVLPQNPSDTNASTLPLNENSADASAVRSATPSTLEHASENTPSASPMTPGSSRLSQQAATAAATPTPSKSAVASPTHTAVPIVPVMPIRTNSDKPSSASSSAAATPSSTTMDDTQKASSGSEVSGGAAPAEKLAEASPPAPLPPKLWSGLFNRAAAGASASGAHTGLNGVAAGTDSSAHGAFSKANANSLAEALLSYRVNSSNNVAFIEPRGLINTGNMCYMNSVLQVLIFCTPFYDFLDQVSRKAAYSFKSETPLLDAMIMFIREFKVIGTADPQDLRRRLKSDELERFGEAFIPEFVYEAIKQLSRFESMRRGHQQDAEEFLGFMLECLNEECTKIMKGQASSVTTPAASVTSESAPDGSAGGDGWLEVGPRQRAAVTRSSGHTSTSPVNSIFAGKLRSELRVPGLKDSVTMEPYQSLQLDIDSPHVRNIVDALRGLTKPEVIHGDFGSPHGKDVSVTKQVFLETLPPVLILHLKRFQFDWQGNGTVKIWKKIGYPLELEIPREIFGRHKRNMYLSEPLPKYRLNAVVYHHGKQASGGHYTVDVLREDGREWIRLDDTVIRRIHSEDVAEGGAEEPASVNGVNSGSNNGGSSGGSRQDATSSANGAGSANRFAGMGEEDAGDSESGWRHVVPSVNGMSKKWSSVANGTASTVSKTKQQKENIKDNRVAYLLFYQRIN